MPENPVIVFTGPRQVTIEDQPQPQPGAGQLLCRTRRSLISTGTELTVLSGEFPAGSAWDEYGKYPFRAGYSNVGEVVAVGPEMDEGWRGRRIASVTPHALYNLVDASQAMPVREDVPDEEATFFMLASIAMNGVRRAEVTWGESVVIYGAGLVGQLAARFCRLAGARPVVVVDIAQERLGLLPDGPALIALNATEENVSEVVGKVTRGRLADVVFEVTGNPALIAQQFAMLRHQGRFVILSSPRGASKFDFHDLCNAPSYTIIGAHVCSHPQHGELDLPWTMGRHAELFFDLVAEKELQVSPLISHRAPYSEAEGLYAMLLEDRSQAMGVVLEWDD